jgi:hypothetical protein
MHTMIFFKNPKLLPVLASSSKKKKKLCLGSQKLEPEIWCYETPPPYMTGNIYDNFYLLALPTKARILC